MSSDFPSKTGGVFAGRKFNMTSSVHPSSKPKVPEPISDAQKPSYNRFLRATRDHDIPKPGTSDTQSVKSNRSTASINSRENYSPRKVLSVLADEPQCAPCKEMGDVLDPREIMESSGIDSEFSLPHETAPNQNGTGQNESSQSLLNQIECLAQMNTRNEEQCAKLRTLVSQLNEKIAVSEQHYRNRIKALRRVQDTSFAEIMIERNEEMNKLHDEITELKSKLEEASQPKHSGEVQAVKDKAQRLRDLLKKRDEEINQLTYKLIDAQTNMMFLEKEKWKTVQLPSCVEKVKDHINVIKQALLTNRTMLKLIESRKYTSDSNNLKDTVHD